MRYVLFFTLLLIAAGSSAATIDLTDFGPCDSSTDYYRSGGCACTLSKAMAGANVGETVSDGEITLSGDNCAGTVYAFAHIAGSPPTYAQCIANTGSLNRQSQSGGTGVKTFTGGTKLTSLTADANTAITYCLVPSGTGHDNRNSHAVITSATFRTNPSTSGPPPSGPATDLTNAGFFIAFNDGGNTDETPTGTAGTATSGCTTMAGACSQFSHINLAMGQNVYFAEGSRFTTQISIGASGSTSDPVEIGCYFDEDDDNGNPAICQF